MRAVFEQSWKLLRESERHVFKRLSVFGGSFGRDAATAIAGASLPALSALVDKSLLQTTPQGRYQIHELLRQFGYEKLQETPEDIATTRASHCDYYTVFAHERYLKIFSPQQRETLQSIAVEIENIRIAWDFAIANALIASLERLAHTYYAYCDLQSRYRESIDSMERVLGHLQLLPDSKEVNLLIALLLSYLGYDYIRVGRYDDSNTVFLHSLQRLQQSGSVPSPGFGTDPLAGLSLLHGTIGNYDEAIRYGEAARQQSEAAIDGLNLQVAYYALAGATFALGEYDRAFAYAQQALTITRDLDHHWMTAYVLTILGNIARGQGDYEQARKHYQESYALKESLDDPEGMAAALNQLGVVALRQQDYTEADRLYQQSLEIYHQIYDRGGLATALKGAANAAAGIEDYHTAYRLFSQALETAVDIQYLPLILGILADIGQIMLATGRQTQAVELLTLALHHSAGEYETREQVRQALDQTGGQKETTNTEPLEMTVAELMPIVDSLQAELNSPENLSPPATQPQSRQIQQGLVDPLSDRELEILNLLAQGLTNKAIAEKLIVVVGTVKSHNHNIFSKLGVHNRVQAIARARELGLLE
jgi:ATP/maltotriose-dependent transcriptional regulator MalT